MNKIDNNNTSYSPRILILITLLLKSAKVGGGEVDIPHSVWRWLFEGIPISASFMDLIYLSI